jgi:spermidine/putrescine transport system permease protein/putrescine transport system permease protein
MTRTPKVLVAITTLFFAIQFLPILVVMLFSFNAQKSLAVFTGFSLRWYEAFFADADLIESVGFSLRVALAAMLGALALGVLLALGIVRSRHRLGALAGWILLIPLVTPEIVTGVASAMLFRGVGLELSAWTLILAELTFSISYVTVILRSRVSALNPEIEQAAMDLGCTRFQAVRLVTLPTLLPAVLACGLLIFAVVFDDFVLAYFTTGISPQPLPVRIYSSIRFGVQPTINAVGTLMLLASIAFIALAVFVPRMFGRKEKLTDLL